MVFLLLMDLKDCGLTKCKSNDDDMLNYIANYLFTIICNVSNFDAVEFQKRLHLSLFEYNPRRKVL